MKVTPTRTLNPLPFGDLEPHRFEDLIRQLAYDLRRWKSLEATGRGGADGGIDIRAIELVPVNEEPPVEDDGESADTSFSERLWIFQCKREKALSPKRLRKVVDESLATLDTPPHGFILAAACDVSKEARDAFREEMVSRGIEEFFLWAKGELEDLLFQPKNDRLLFAYFGIALQPRRRNLATALRSEITKKKQLEALIGEEGGRDGKLVLLRDPTDERYPHQPKSSESPARWLLCRALTCRKPGHLIVLQREHLAAITSDGTRWDAILDHDAAASVAAGELASANAWNAREIHDRSPYDFWNEYIDESRRAYLKLRRAVPLERILALDPLGDGFFPVPHILVEFVDTTGPFTNARYPSLEHVHHMGGEIDIDLSDSNRATIFPRPLPAEGEPEPEGFDDTSKETTPLSPATRHKLQELLTKVAADKGLLAGLAEAEAAQARSDETVNKMHEFQQWRKKVALPTFSSFVPQLRAGGHRARVVTRSVSALPSPEYREAFESVELRVQLHTATPYNFAGYFRPGRIHISLSQHIPAWRIDISPLEARERNGHGTSVLMKPTAATTVAELENWVLTILDRLKRNE